MEKAIPLVYDNNNEKKNTIIHQFLFCWYYRFCLGFSWLLIFIKCMNYRCMTSFWNGITYGLDCSYNFFQVNIFPSSMQEVMAVRAKY